MRRLFWVAVGAAGAVLVAGRVRRTAARYTPAGLTEQAEEAGRRASSALREALDRLGSARREREEELRSTLLATPEHGDASAVFGRGRHAGPAAGRPDPTGPPTAHPDPEVDRRAAGPPGRVDLDEPLNDF